MSGLSEIIPKDRQLVIDLVRAAGVDVRDWENFRIGASKAPSNPKYCYEWAFVEPHKVVVLNLWHSSMQERDGSVLQDLNMRDLARQFEQLRKPVWKRRSLRMDLAIQAASREGLPIRVIVCEGERRAIEEPGSRASRVYRRLLDPVPWAVTRYDWNTGQCTLTRGERADRFADQFSIDQEVAMRPERREVTAHPFSRNPEVRRRVRERSQGKCEWCGAVGFEMANGQIYIETHHVIALEDGGSDTEENVVALCANHHREAHHGVHGSVMRESLLARLTNVGEPGLSSGQLRSR